MSNSHFARDLHQTSNRNVFVMMRYRSEPYYAEIEKAIRQTLHQHGLVARLAKDRVMADDLWKNIAYYMDNCSIGIAVFEKVDAQDYNSNVSIEVGYMLAQSKPCLLLKEKRLACLPTDFCGKIYRSFDIMSIQTSVSNAVSDWLKDIGWPLFRSNIFYVILVDTFNISENEILRLGMCETSSHSFIDALEVNPVIDKDMESGEQFRTFINNPAMRTKAEELWKMLHPMP